MSAPTLCPTRQVRETAPPLPRTAQIAARVAAELAQPRPRVATWLTTRESLEANAAGHGDILFARCLTLDAVRTRLRRGEVDAVLVSATLMDSRALLVLGALVHDFPVVLFAGLSTEADRGQALRGVQLLGNAGIRVLIDSQRLGGWSVLRELLGPTRLPEPFMREALAAVLSDLEDGSASSSVRCSDGCRWFFRTIFTTDVLTIRQVARDVGLSPQTFMSRFTRAGLPSPRQYLTLARLVRAAHLAETPGLTVSTISERIGASSPQSFSRTLRHTLGITGWEFRKTLTGRCMLDRFRAVLILPYRDTLRTFDPVAGAGGRHREALGQATAGRRVAP